MFSQCWLWLESASARTFALNMYQGDSLLPSILQESLLLRSPAYHPQCGCHISHMWAASKDYLDPLPDRGCHSLTLEYS